jgi:ABC-type sugar transport system ATPase subunit
VSGLRVEGLAAELGGRRVLDALSLHAGPGELVAVVGPSGAGKSTLLRCVAGLHEPAAGRVEVEGRDVTAASPEARGVAMVFQSYALFPHLDVAQNIGFGLRARKVDGADARVREVAGRLGLDGLLERRPAQLSGGERQRVALARALAGDPAVLLLDEPLSNLDAPLRARARAELREVLTGGPAVVHVTHDQHEAMTLGTRIAVLVAGRVLQAGPPDEVYARPSCRAVAAFLGAPAMNLLDAVAERGVVRAGAVEAQAHVPDGPVVLGVRPEHLRPVAERGRSPLRPFPARLLDVERAGHDVVWHVQAGEHRLAVRPPEGAEATEELRLAATQVHLFADDEDGRAL